MVQVHTVFRSARWQTIVDGLCQVRGPASRSGAVAEGRRLAAELHGRHIVHDIDGTVVERDGTAVERDSPVVGRTGSGARTTPALARRDPVDYLG